eukprot:1675770-Pyramimonas_sp.AAC.1
MRPRVPSAMTFAASLYRSSAMAASSAACEGIYQEEDLSGRRRGHIPARRTYQADAGGIYPRG